MTLNWSAATDDVGVARYVIHRSTTPGFTPSAATKIATVASGTTYLDAGLAPATYVYRVIAEDAAGNAGPPSAAVSAPVAGDTTAPAVALTAPAAGAVVRSIATLTATATDDVGVAGVQFTLDGANRRRGGHERPVLRHLGHHDGDGRRPHAGGDRPRRCRQHHGRPPRSR